MNKRAGFFAILLIVSVTALIGSGSAATAADMMVEPTDGGPLEPGETATYEVTLTQVDNGIGAYEFTVESTTPAAVKVTNATLASELQGSLTSVSVADDGSTVSVEGVNTGDAFDATDYVMLEIRVTATESGTSELRLDPKYVQDADGNSYTIDSVTKRSVTVWSQQTTSTTTSEPTTESATTTAVGTPSITPTSTTTTTETPGFTFLAGIGSLLGVALFSRRVN